jgi:uncharacterized membrane protein YcaP (DUF421 family)
MKKEEISLFDVERILFGEAPVEFLIETLFRTIVIFLFLIVFLRLIGKRMGGMLTFSELAVMLMLGAILALPMQAPDRGLLQGIMILIGVLFFYRTINLYECRMPKLEYWTQGKAFMLVKDGIVMRDQMREARISKQQLYAELRKEGIVNLGKVKRVYLEACGMFSIYTFKKKDLGLPIYPPSDKNLNVEDRDTEKDYLVCQSCGNILEEHDKDEPCSICHELDWKKSSYSLIKVSRSGD